jgi:hypothetical protein
LLNIQTSKLSQAEKEATQQKLINEFAEDAVKILETRDKVMN